MCVCVLFERESFFSRGCLFTGGGVCVREREKERERESFFLRGCLFTGGGVCLCCLREREFLFEGLFVYWRWCVFVCVCVKLNGSS